MPKLIILDFDGTLADTREIIVRTNQEALVAAGAHHVVDDFGEIASLI